MKLVIMYFLNGDIREAFPNLRFGKSKMFFYSNSSSHKTLSINSTVFFPCLMDREFETKLEAQDKRGKSYFQRTFPKVVYKAHLTQN